MGVSRWASVDLLHPEDRSVPFFKIILTSRKLTLVAETCLSNLMQDFLVLLLEKISPNDKNLFKYFYGMSI